MGRTPLGGNGALDESMTHNYPGSLVGARTSCTSPTWMYIPHRSPTHNTTPTDLTVHSTSFCFSPKGLGLDAEADPLPHPTKPATTTSSTPPAAAAAAASTPPGSSSRYFLRSAEKKARELSAAKAREQAEAAKPRAAGVTASGGGNSSLRKSPRLAAAASSSATRSQALAAANARRGSFTGAGAQQGRGQQRLFGGEEEEEEGVGQLVEVGEAEYSKTPSFIRIQVTRDMLNAAIAAINAHVAAAGPQLEPMVRACVWMFVRKYI